MVSLIILIVTGGFFAYFATQNTMRISVSMFHYTINNVPVYALVLAALLLGIFISFIISLFGSVSNFLTIFGKNSEIKKDEAQISALNKRVRELELENERLKVKTS